MTNIFLELSLYICHMSLLFDALDPSVAIDGNR